MFQCPNNQCFGDERESVFEGKAFDTFSRIKCVSKNNHAMVMISASKRHDQQAALNDSLFLLLKGDHNDCVDLWFPTGNVA